MGEQEYSKKEIRDNRELALYKATEYYTNLEEGIVSVKRRKIFDKAKKIMAHVFEQEVNEDRLKRHLRKLKDNEILKKPRRGDYSINEYVKVNLTEEQKIWANNIDDYLISEKTGESSEPAVMLEQIRDEVKNLVSSEWDRIWEAIPTDQYKSAHEIAKDAGLIKSHMNKFEREALIQDLQRDLKVFIYECEYEGRKPPLESTKDGFRRLE